VFSRCKKIVWLVAHAKDEKDSINPGFSTSRGRSTKEKDLAEQSCRRGAADFRGFYLLIDGSSLTP